VVMGPDPLIVGSPSHVVQRAGHLFGEDGGR
jgi:hypothetical protein